jgi:hypothetical protein
MGAALTTGGGQGPMRDLDPGEGDPDHEVLGQEKDLDLEKGLAVDLAIIKVPFKPKRMLMIMMKSRTILIVMTLVDLDLRG